MGRCPVSRKAFILIWNFCLPPNIEAASHAVQLARPAGDPIDRARSEPGAAPADHRRSAAAGQDDGKH